MRLQRYVVLPWLWYGTFATCASGMVLAAFTTQSRLAGFLWGMPIFVAMVLGLVTYFSVRHDVYALSRPWLYRVLVGSLLLTSTATLVASGSTLVITSRSPLGILGMVFLGLFNVGIAMLAWRALTKPTPRRAARVGALATGLELFAIIPDALMQMSVIGTADETWWTVVAVLGAFISIATGGLACIASMVAFGEREDDSLPTARVVD